MEKKKSLRKTMLAKRDALDPGIKSMMDEAINAKMAAYIRNLNPACVHCYIPMGSEINLVPTLEFLLREGVTVVTPRSLPGRKMQHLVLASLDKLENGIYGTRHPANGKEYQGNYDLIIVPGLAFDERKYRLGYGAGYYDIFLANHVSAKKAGPCYPFQLIHEVPVEPHDIRLDEIIY